MQPEEVLFREGDRDCQFFVVLAGMVASVEGYGTAEESVISVHGRGRFLGELSLLTGEGSYYTAVAAEEGEVLAVPAGRLRELVACDQGIGDLILRAYLIRRSILIGLGAGLRIIGSRYSPDARRVRDFAARNRLPYRWLDLDGDPGAEALLARFGVAPQDTPIVILHGRMLRNPGNAELAAAAGLPAPTASPARCDLLVVGSGPGGMSAAVYGASEGLRTMVLECTATGGQAGTSSRIENYLGFPSGISGAELAERAMLQARKFGAEFVVPAEAVSIEEDGGQYLVRLTDGSPVTATSVVIATGARYRRLDVPRLDHFEKTSVYYAASQAEALLCAGDPVAIVGGGNSAGQAAVFLSRHAAQVTLIAREHDLSEYMSRYLIDQLDRIPNVQVMLVDRGAGAARRPGPGGGGRGGRPDRRAERAAGPRAVRLHRRQALQRLARRPGRPGRPRLRPDRPGHGELRAGDEPAGHLRRGRRAQRLGQAGRHGGRRGRDGHQARLRKNPAGIAGRRIPGRRGTMTHATWPDGADVLARASRHWGWMMTFGVISLLAGVAVLAWPGRTLIVVAVLFGIQLVVTGIFRFVAAFASEDLTGGTRVLLAVLGVLSLIIGLYAVRHVLVTLLALALLLGIYWIVNGAVELFMALSARGVPGAAGPG